MIGLWYKNMLGSPPRTEWKTAVSIILNVFNLSKYQHCKVYKIFEQCKTAESKEDLYDGSALLYSLEYQQVINKDSVDLQIIADIMELGENYRGAAEVLDCWDERKGQYPIAHST
eukprot:729365-Ditylum_brightwellii.AAC.1